MTNLIQIKSADDISEDISEDMVVKEAPRKRLVNGVTTEDYRKAMYGEGDSIVAYNWTDKPHRLIYDLCGEIEFLEQELQNQAAVLAQCKAALEKYREGLDKLYSHNEAVRHAVVDHFGTLHPTALAAIDEMEKGKSKIIPDDICGLCYHPKTESNSCTRPDCNLGGEHG